MPRLARVVIPGIPHHVTHRGNRRQAAFFCDFREGWRGHLWQGRFASYPTDDVYMHEATRYVELNPVRAKPVSEPAEYRWSNARAHLDDQDDALVNAPLLLDRFGDWREFLSTGLSGAEAEVLCRHERIPNASGLGSAEFVARMEKLLDRTLAPRKPGCKPKPKRTAKPS